MRNRRSLDEHYLLELLRIRAASRLNNSPPKKLCQKHFPMVFFSDENYELKNCFGRPSGLVRL